MMPLLLLAAASADLDALDQAVARCDRNAAVPAFSGETARRSQFLLDAYREQEAIVAARTDLADRRRAWRESAMPIATVAGKAILNGVSHFRHAELVSASIPETSVPMTIWTLKRVQGDAGMRA